MKKSTKELKSLNEELSSIEKMLELKIEHIGLRSERLLDSINKVQAVLDQISGIPSEKKEILKKVKKETTELIEIVTNKKIGIQIAKLLSITGVLGVKLMKEISIKNISLQQMVSQSGLLGISRINSIGLTTMFSFGIGSFSTLTGVGGISTLYMTVGLFGPIVLPTAAIIGTLTYQKKSYERKIVEKLNVEITNREINRNKLAIVEINERNERMDSEHKLIEDIVREILTFGTNYKKMNEVEQYKLGSCINVLNSSYQLIINPILSLQPYFKREDFFHYLNIIKYSYLTDKERDLIIFFVNLLYKINLNQKDSKIIWKQYRNNEDFLEGFAVSKKDFDYSLMEIVDKILIPLNTKR